MRSFWYPLRSFFATTKRFIAVECVVCSHKRSGSLLSVKGWRGSKESRVNEAGARTAYDFFPAMSF